MPKPDAQHATFCVTLVAGLNSRLSASIFQSARIPAVCANSLGDYRVTDSVRGINVTVTVTVTVIVTVTVTLPFSLSLSMSCRRIPARGRTQCAFGSASSFDRRPDRQKVSIHARYSAIWSATNSVVEKSPRRYPHTRRI